MTLQSKLKTDLEKQPLLQVDDLELREELNGLAKGFGYGTLDSQYKTMLSIPRPDGYGFVPPEGVIPK